MEVSLHDNKTYRITYFRGNNLLKDDAYCLKHAMVYMPNVEVLNLSDNFLQDDGIMSVTFSFLIDNIYSNIR